MPAAAEMTDEQFIAMIRPHGLGQVATFRQTMTACRDVIARGVPGDFVECGVYKGVEPAIMLREMHADDLCRRRVHLFDCFTGIPEPGPEDAADIRACLTNGDGSFKFGVASCDLEGVRGNLARWVGDVANRAKFHCGLFEQTVPLATEMSAFYQGIAILRLDGDLYRSTQVCLEHLEPLVNPGGYVIIDDYNVVGCRRAVDEYLAAKGLSPTIIPIAGSDGPAYWIK